MAVYTHPISQGCSGCQANVANLNKLARMPAFLDRFCSFCQGQGLRYDSVLGPITQVLEDRSSVLSILSLTSSSFINI